MNWQPIETVPKDREIIVCGRYAPPCIVSWNKAERDFCATFQDEWVRNDEGDYHFSGPLSHWMELPTPPEKDPDFDD